jgi:hypothetical protein
MVFTEYTYLETYVLHSNCLIISTNVRLTQFLFDSNKYLESQTQDTQTHAK